MKNIIDQETEDAIGQYELPQIKKNSSPKRKQEIFSIHYANQDQLDKKYTIDNIFTDVQKQSRLPNVKSTSHLREGRSKERAKHDKNGLLSTLEKIDITNVARNSNLLLQEQGATSFSPSITSKVLYRPGEVFRQINQTMKSLRMKKLSEIRNYQQADNETLTRQIKVMKRYTSVPKFSSKK